MIQRRAFLRFLGVGTVAPLVPGEPGVIGYGPPMAASSVENIATARKSVALSSGKIPEFRRRELMRDAWTNVACDSARAVDPSPRGAPPWLRRKLHTEAEYKFLERQWREAQTNWLDRLLFGAEKGCEMPW